MAFQAMNHGLEARATSPPRVEATHNSREDRVLALPQIAGGKTHCIHPVRKKRLIGVWQEIGKDRY